MALRIGGMRNMPQAEETMPEEMMEMEQEAPVEEDLMSELPASLEEEAASSDQGTLDPLKVHYKTGEERMSEACAHCQYYIPDGLCQLVSGDIDPDGVCNLFTDAGASEELPSPELETEMVEEIPEPEEASEEMA